jgi:hypothetical protein
MTDLANRPTNEPAVAIAFDDELLRMEDMGAENITAKNSVIPRLTILQGLSPQLNKKKSEYIEGAEIGDFCNVAAGDVYRREISVIPCYFDTIYIEWVKNRGGLATIHGNEKILAKCTRNDRFQNVLPDGNIIEETSQWYCLLQDGANWTGIFFPLRATNLKHSRRWLTLVTGETLQDADKHPWKPPLFWRSWRLRVVDDSNERGDWVTFRPEKGATTLELDPSRRLIRVCMDFYEGVRTKAARGDLDGIGADDGD